MSSCGIAADLRAGNQNISKHAHQLLKAIVVPTPERNGHGPPGWNQHALIENPATWQHDVTVSAKRRLGPNLNGIPRQTKTPAQRINVIKIAIYHPLSSIVSDYGLIVQIPADACYLSIR
jgi:hypothetical protein